MNKKKNTIYNDYDNQKTIAIRKNQSSKNKLF